MRCPYTMDGRDERVRTAQQSLSRAGCGKDGRWRPRVEVWMLEAQKPSLSYRILKRKSQLSQSLGVGEEREEIDGQRTGLFFLLLLPCVCVFSSSRFPIPHHHGGRCSRELIEYYPRKHRRLREVDYRLAGHGGQQGWGQGSFSGEDPHPRPDWAKLPPICQMARRAPRLSPFGVQNHQMWVPTLSGATFRRSPGRDSVTLAPPASMFRPRREVFVFGRSASVTQLYRRAAWQDGHAVATSA